MPFVTFANTASGAPNAITETLAGFVFKLIGFLCLILALVFSFFLWLIGIIFDWIIAGTTINASTMNDIVTAGWVIVRDVLNIVFVLALLGIAFATILRIESYNFKALLPKLLVAALLVNFSKTIALTLVDFSNAVMSGIMGTQGGMTSSAAIAALFNISSFFEIKNAIRITNGDLQVLITNIAIVVFIGMLCMALAGLAVLLVIRTVVLMILVVFSPIAFVLNILPVTQKYASRWWEEFIKYLFVGPVVCICYLLALLFAVQFSQGGVQNLANNASQFQANVGISSATVGQLFGFLIACGIMFVGFTFTKEVASGMAGAVMGLVQKGLTGTAGLLGGWGLRRMAKFGKGPISEGAKHLLGRADSRWLNGRGSRLLQGLDTRLAGFQEGGALQNAVGKTLRALPGLPAKLVRSAAGFPHAWKARQARLQAEYLEPAAGEAHDLMNFVLGAGEKTYFERRATKEIEHKKMKEMGAKSSAEQRAIFLGARSFAEKAAALTQIVASNNSNDLMNESDFFNRHRARLIEASRENEIFANEDARERHEAIVQGNIASGMNIQQAREAARRVIPDNDLAVTATSDPVWDPILFKEALYEELGGDTNEAAELMADLSEIGGDSGVIPMYGTATYDRVRGRWRKTDKASQLSVIEDKRRKSAARSFSNKAHSNTYFRETTDGQLSDLHEEGWHMVMHDDWDAATKFAEHGRGDVKDGYMAVIRTGPRGRQIANHHEIKRRARLANTGGAGSDRAKIEDELRELRAVGAPSAAQRKRIDYLQKEESSLRNRAQIAYTKALSLEYSQAHSLTDETGTNIEAAVRAANPALGAGADIRFEHIRRYVEGII